MNNEFVMKNEFTLDGKIQKDVKDLDSVIVFNLSVVTGKTKTLKNKDRDKFTFIKVLYLGEINDEVRNLLQEGNFVRVYGKLDSEQYVVNSGKVVYNKILSAHKVEKIDGKE